MSMRRGPAAIGLAAVAAALAVTAPSRAPAQERVDLLLRNGKVFTADPLWSTHSVVAVRGGRVVAVGGPELEARYQAARVVDLRGRLVTPGFIDTHIHVRGTPRFHVDLSHFESIDAIKQAIAAKAREVGPGQWVTGDGWAEGLVRERRPPLRADLDQAAPDNPVVLARAGGHSAVANSRALALAGITRETPNPEGGVIERDERGELNGVIRERQDLVYRLVPRPTAEELRPSFVANLKRLLSLGITSIIDAGAPPAAFAEWERIYQAHRGELPRAAVQIYPGLARGGASAVEAIRRLEAFGRKTGDGDAWLRVGAVKLWIDGGYAGPAAWTLEPYKGQPTYFGIQNVDEGDFYAVASAAHRAGWQMGIHAIGDAAIKLSVDVLARVIREHPRADHRHYLNHFTVVPPLETLRTMALANLLIAQQPNFTWAPTLESRYVENLDGERLARNNSLRTPMRHGIFVALGSDNHPIGPMEGLYAAVTRKGSSGRVYAEDERLTMPEAIAGYTRNGAYLTFEEAEKGTIEPGKLADLVVLSEDLIEAPAERILGIEVDMTILDGRIVYERAGTPSSKAGAGRSLP
jgi:predicted amidohydrolase YtcJ